MWFRGVVWLVVMVVRMLVVMVVRMFDAIAHVCMHMPRRCGPHA